MKALILTTTVLLSGCALNPISPANKIASYTEDDATAAIAIAKANNDAAGVTCYTAVLNAVKTVAAPQPNAGILVANETARVSAAQWLQVQAACVGLL